MFRITIPSFHKRENANDVYTVFVVEVLVCASGKITQIEKRYSEFEELHKQLKKCMWTPEFPPKKMNKWSSKVLEQRRVGLQNYLQGILQEHDIPKYVFSFLGIDVMSDSQNSLDKVGRDEYPTMSTNQPMVAFPRDAFLNPSTQSSIADIIVEGVHLGLYTMNCDELI